MVWAHPSPMTELRESIMLRIWLSACEVGVPCLVIAVTAPRTCSMETPRAEAVGAACAR